jgi:hypothetical protein
MLMRVEQIYLKDDKEEVISHFDWIPQNNWDIPADSEARGWGIPLQLPVFPAAPGRIAERFKGDAMKDRSTREDVQKGKDVQTSGGLLITATAVTPTRESNIKENGLKVTFTHRVVYSRSGNHDYLRLEQIWLPGNPWWSIAWDYQDTTQKGKAFLLADNSIKHEPLNPGSLSLAPYSSPSPEILPDNTASKYPAEKKELIPPLLEVAPDYESVSAHYSDASGMDVSSVKIYVDKIDCTAEAAISSDKLMLRWDDDTIVPDLSVHHRIEVRVRDIYGNLQRISTSSHIFDPEGIDTGNPTPKTAIIAYNLYREGDVLIRMRAPEEKMAYHSVKIHQKPGINFFEWDGKDDHGKYLPQGNSVIEIFYCDKQPLEQIGSIEIP